jgi:UDP-glucose 4-epimerase
VFANSRVLITGGAGFIGASLTARLLALGAEVVVYDNFLRNSLQHIPLPNAERLKVVRGDVRDRSLLDSVLEGVKPDYIFHAAAIAGVDSVLRDPIETFKINLLGSVNLIEASAKLREVKRVVLFSTSEVFGEYAYLPDEGKAMTIGKVGEARWNYAVSKLAEEHFALSYYQRHGLPVVIVRPFNVYGPAQVGDSAMRTFVQRALRGEPLYVHGDGSQIRAWCYIDDMVDALVAILQREEAIGETFNIGNPATAISVYNLAKLVIRVVGSPSEVVLIPKDYADIALRVPSITRAMRLLGFLPKVDLEEGILRTAEFYRRML